MILIKFLLFALVGAFIGGCFAHFIWHRNKIGTIFSVLSFICLSLISLFFSK